MVNRNYSSYLFKPEDIIIETPPSELPVSIDDVKNYIRVDGNDEDTLILQFIESAVDKIDGVKGIGYALMKQTWRYILPYGSVKEGCDIVLPGQPVRVDDGATLHYTSPGSSTETTLGLQIRELNGQGYIFVTEPDAGWPDIDFGKEIYIDYSLGHAKAADVPSDLKIAIYALVNMYYQDRSMSHYDNSMMICAILERYRTLRFGT